jgi:hypothetical protein
MIFLMLTPVRAATTTEGGIGMGWPDSKGIPEEFMTPADASSVSEASSTSHQSETQLSVVVRPMEAVDRAGIEAMISRCSAETLYRRFFTPIPQPAEDETMLDRLPRVGPGDAVDVVEVAGRIVGLGSSAAKTASTRRKSLYSWKKMPSKDVGSAPNSCGTLRLELRRPE